jgi:hypothetical protein
LFHLTAVGGAVTGRGFALVVPGKAAWTPGNDRALPPHLAAYLVPANGALSGPLTVEFQVPGENRPLADLQIHLAGHGPLESLADPARGTLSAVAPGPGLFYLAEGVSTLPDARTLRILSATPNPFHASTRILFTTESRQRVRVTVHDPAGRLVSGLHDAEVGSGTHEVPWDGTNAEGVPAAGGIYFIRVASDDAVATRKILLQR